MSPMLENPRHETFAERVALGAAQSRAYIAAGYKARGNAAESEAAQLVRKPQVAARILELRTAVAARLEKSADDIARIAWAIAEDTAQPPAARIAALNLEARRFREYADKQEHSGPGGGPIPLLAGLALLSERQLRLLIEGVKDDR